MLSHCIVIHWPPLSLFYRPARDVSLFRFIHFIKKKKEEKTFLIIIIIIIIIIIVIIIIVVVFVVVIYSCLSSDRIFEML